MGFKAVISEIAVVLGLISGAFAVVGLALELAGIGPEFFDSWTQFIFCVTFSLGAFALSVILVRAMDFYVLDGDVELSADGSELTALYDCVVNVWSPLRVSARPGSIVTVRGGAFVVADHGSQVTIEAGGACLAMAGSSVVCKRGGKLMAEAGAAVKVEEGAEILPWGGHGPLGVRPSWLAREECANRGQKC